MNVESGMYDELELTVRKLRLKRTYDGVPFDVTVRTDTEAGLALWPGVRIETGEPSNPTVQVAMRDWFRGESSGLIEPARLETEQALQAQAARERGGLATGVCRS
jgi:hypothetical protein